MTINTQANNRDKSIKPLQVLKISSEKAENNDILKCNGIIFKQFQKILNARLAFVGLA